MLSLLMAVGLSVGAWFLSEPGAQRAHILIGAVPYPYTPDVYELVLPGVHVSTGVATWVRRSPGSDASTARTAATVLGNRAGIVVFYDHCSRAVRRVSALDFSLESNFFEPVPIPRRPLDEPDAELTRYCRSAQVGMLAK